MKILHTSDWHLGNRLMDRSRAAEFRLFLDWLLETMQREQVDVLLISGDIFDTPNPSDGIQELYCNFLSKADTTGCRHIILTAGNHDGCSLLEKEAPLLYRHRVQVFTRVRREDPAGCRITLTDADGTPCGTVYAVPYLRIPDVAIPVGTDAPEEERRTAYIRGIAEVYATLAEDAATQKQAHGGPVIAMGHVAVQGAELTDSVMHTIGTLDTVGHNIFSDVFDYVALGHIHKPSRPSGSDRLRYCGSPLPMGTDEAGYEHSVLLAEISDTAEPRLQVTAIPVPRFVLYRQCSCNTREELEALPTVLMQDAQRCAQEDGFDTPRPIWVNIKYTGGDIGIDELQELLSKQLPQAGVEHFQAQRTPILQAPQQTHNTSLKELTPRDVFLRKLKESEGSTPRTAEQCEQLIGLFNHVLTQVSAETSH